MLNKKTDNKIYVYRGIDAYGKFGELEESVGGHNSVPQNVHQKRLTQVTKKEKKTKKPKA